MNKIIKFLFGLAWIYFAILVFLGRSVPNTVIEYSLLLAGISMLKEALSSKQY